MFQTLRWPRGDRSRCGDGILLVPSDERRRLTPARKASEGTPMPVSDPSAFTGGELLAAVDELCQDFIWSSPNRLYPVQAPDGLLNRTGPAVSCKLVSFAGEGRASGPNTAAATLRSGESSPQSCRTDELKMDHFMKPLAVHRTERSGVIEQGCVANRMATCLRPSSYTIPAAGRL